MVRVRRSSVLFWLAVVVLGGGAGLMQEAKHRGWLQLIKKPLPIRKPLRDFERERLSPFKFVDAKRLAPETEAELQTEEYFVWLLDLPQANKPWRGQLSLSVTYYTGKQDQVPHVPEECFIQGAFSPGSDDTLRMEMAPLGRSLDIRRLSFYPPRQVGNKMYVYYTINVNNDFCVERNQARIRMGNPRDTHLFYSKVEVSFEGVEEERRPELDGLAGQLLGKALAELTVSHWPLKGWERGGPPTDGGESTN